MIFLRFLQRVFPEVFEKDKDEDTSRKPESARRHKKRRRGPAERDETIKGQRRARSQGGRDPTTDKKSLRATGFHPKNPWRGKLEEEEIIVLPSMVYYRGQGVK